MNPATQHITTADLQKECCEEIGARERIWKKEPGEERFKNKRHNRRQELMKIAANIFCVMTNAELSTFLKRIEARRKAKTAKQQTLNL